LRSESESADTIKELIEKVQLAAGGIRIDFKIPLSFGAGEANSRVLTVSRFAPLHIKRRGGAASGCG